jgi:hypothetical protein
MQRHHLQTKRRDRETVERICRECHRTIHGLFSHRELAAFGSELATVEGLRAAARFQRALTFIRKRPPGVSIRMRLSKAARGKRR